MTKNDYIEKITQNLEHLTKDELKDVSILTTAQLGVRSKFAERQQLEHEIANLTSQLQQQALPVVPEFVAGAIESIPDHYSAFEAILLIEEKIETLPVENEDWLPVYDWLCEGVENQDIFALAFITGKYEVEKPQLFYLRDELTGQFLAKDNQFKDKDRYFFWTGEDQLTHSIGTAWKLSFTQQEIDSMQTGSYEQIEVEK